MRTVQKENRLLRWALVLCVFLTALSVCRVDAAAKAKISKSSVVLLQGQKYQLTMTGVSAKKKITWKSQNKKVAKVNAKGKVTAVSKGKTKIVATVGKKTYKCTVQVKKSLTKVKLNKTSVQMKVGNIQTLAAAFSPRVDVSPKLQWSSGNTGVATVTQKGVVKAVGAGTATITAVAKDGSGKKAACIVSVTQENILVESLTLNKTSAEMKEGEHLALIRYISPATATNTAVKWTSSNEGVATVNSMGLVESKAVGTATITAKAKDGSGKKATCAITVIADAPQPVAGARAQKLLKCLAKYEAQLQADKAKGVFWHYYRKLSIEGAKYPLTWELAMQPGALKAIDCASFVRWGLKEVGALGPKDSFWDTGPGEAKGNDTLYFSTEGARERLTQNCDLIQVRRTARDLIADGTLQAGDVCTWMGMGHTSVYAGNGLWYDAGHATGINGHYSDDGLYIFDTWGPVNLPYRLDSMVDYIIRVKG